MKIVLSRIDNRLIHGQTAVTWSNQTNTNLIVVVSDGAAEDKIRQSIMKMAVPAGVGVRFFSVEKAIDTLPKASDKQLIMLIFETPQDVLRLIEGGIPIKEVNVGNIHFSEGKKQISSTVSLSEEEIEVFNKLDALGVKCVIQRVPTERGVDIQQLLKSN